MAINAPEREATRPTPIHRGAVSQRFARLVEERIAGLQRSIEAGPSLWNLAGLARRRRTELLLHIADGSGPVETVLAGKRFNFGLEAAEDVLSNVLRSKLTPAPEWNRRRRTQPDTIVSTYVFLSSEVQGLAFARTSRTVDTGDIYSDGLELVQWQAFDSRRMSAVLGSK